MQQNRPADSLLIPLSLRPSGLRKSATMPLAFNGGQSVAPTVTGRISLKVESSETLYLGDDIQIDTKSGKYTCLFGGGYCEFNPRAQENPKFYYYTKDHLGNIRNVLAKDENGGMREIQRTAYYPFGGIIADLSMGRKVQNRFYNGKEMDFLECLNWLDYVARPYDPTRGQFTNYDQHCESYYNTDPLTYCHNRPNMLIDPNGMDDYYDRNGSFLFTNNRQTDEIFVVDNCTFFTNKDGVNMARFENKESIRDADLSAKAWSGILTNTLSMMGIDVSELDGGAISVLEMHRADGNTVEIDDTYNNPNMSYENDQNAVTDGHNITANIMYGNKDMWSTRSNIQSLLGIHEYYCHIKAQLEHYYRNVNGKIRINKKDNMTLFMNIMSHPTWKKTTDDYKKRILQEKAYYLSD